MVGNCWQGGCAIVNPRHVTPQWGVCCYELTTKSRHTHEIIVTLLWSTHSMEVGIHHGILLADYAWGNPYGITDIP